MRRSLYDLLGVRPDDDAENLRKAFLKAAKESHPDHHGDDPEAARRFSQIAEAYDILRDTEKRAAYDRLLEVERRPLRSKLKSVLSDAKSHIVTDAIVSVILTIVLVGGYDLYSRMSETPVDEGAGMTAHDSAEVATAVQSGAGQRDRPVGMSAPEMPAVLPIENPVAPDDASPAGRTIEVARGDSGADVPVGQAGAKEGPYDSAQTRGDEPRDRHDARPVDAQVPAVDAQVPAAEAHNGVVAPANKPDSKTPEAVGASADIAKQPVEPAETHNGVPGPSSSGIAALANKPDSKTPESVGSSTGTAKPPPETRESARLHAAMKRPPASRAPFRHASLAHRHTVDSQYCEPDAFPVLGSGY
jgi:hypothetical protein